MKDFYNNNDKVFKEKITSHEFKFDSSAWDKMEKMLDDEDPSKAVAWRYPYMMMILGIFFLGMTLLSPVADSNEVVAKIEHTKIETSMKTATSVPTMEPAIATTKIKSTDTSNKQANANKVGKSQTKKSSKITNSVIEKSVYNNTNSTTTTQNITPSISKSTPIETVKTYIENIPSTPNKHENIQAFMEVNSLLEPVKYDDAIVANLPFEREPIVLRKKRVKVGVQAGASVVLAKRTLADQGKIATAIGGFINLDIDAKNSIAIEANYKNGFSKGTILARNNNQQRNDPGNGGYNSSDQEFEDYVQKHGFTEVHNVERVHAVELPVIYKRKIGKRNSIIAGVKPSLLKFKNSAELDDLALEAAVISTDNMVVDFGLVAGLEHQINKNFSVDIRYNQGLLDISEIEEVKNTNSELALTMKYTF